jgi:hypothetical protein
MKMRAYAAPSFSRENSRSSSPSDVRNHHHSCGPSLKTGCRKTMAGALVDKIGRTVRTGFKVSAKFPIVSGVANVRSAPLETSAVRRLAAILVADVAGYSRLMGADEGGTLARLRAIRHQLLDPKIAGHNGRLVKTTGDGHSLSLAVWSMHCAVPPRCKPRC